MSLSTSAMSGRLALLARLQTSNSVHKRHSHSRITCAAASKSAAQSNGTPLPAGAGAVVTDTAVPEGHQGLHSFLYGEGGAEAHETGSSQYRVRKGEDDGSTLIDVETYISSREGEKPVGVYAIYDTNNNLQYVGYSRNVVLSIKAHLSRVGEDRCARCKVMVFANKAMQSKSALMRECENWLAEAGTVPPGNGAEQDEWEGTVFDPSILSADELAEYEEKKLKMRKAMGENLADDVEGETIDAKQRRLNLIKAVEGDNWSEVIDGQTQETIDGDDVSSATATTTATAPQHPAASPFSRASVHRSVGKAADDTAAASTDKKETPAPAIMMTKESVDKALDEVRPYLIADGGNVDVVDVVNGTVLLELQGACGTCPSSSATMKMGIERSLKAAFGDQLVEVVQVGMQDASASVAAVDMQLNALRGAIHSYGGDVEVLSVENGVCTLKYKGPMPIGYGIRAAVVDKFPDLKQVVMLDSESGEPIKF